MYRFVIAALVAVGVPGAAHAAVLISEVAWMGTTENANAEWIELYNDGPAQDLSGWTLAATDGQPAMSLSGSIQANGYALLERTSDDTVPGVTAFAVYTGAMGNTGEVLELRDENGVLVDRVDGSGDWAIGGDNVTKETLQRSGTPPTGSFFTGAPTPQGGSTPSTNDTTGDTTNNTTSGTVAGTHTSKSGTGGNILYGTKTERADPPLQLKPSLTLLLPEERTVTVRVPTEYAVRAFRESGKEFSITDVTWNFGDGSTAHGMHTKHTYAYPGTYIVSVTGKRSGFAEGIEETVRMTVRVVEPDVTVSKATSAYIELTNTSTHEVDLSGYVLLSGGKAFTLPQGTILLSDTAVRFPSSRTGLAGGAGTALYHPSGALTASFGTTAASAPVQTRQSSVASYSSTRAVEQPTPTSEVTTRATGTDLVAGAPLAYAFEGEAGDVPNDRPLWWWLIGLGAVLLVTVTGILLSRRDDTEHIMGFEIESDE